MEIQDVSLRPPKRMRAIRVKSNPITTRRQVKDDERKLPDRQMESASDTKIHGGPVLVPRLPPRLFAGTDPKLSNDQGIRYTDDLELALSQGRAVWRRTKKHPWLGGRTSPTSPEPLTVAKRKKTSAIDQMTNDKKMSDPLQAIGHNLHDLGGKLETLNDELRVLSDEFTMQDVSMRSFRRIDPSPARDFRATAHDLQMLMKAPSPSRDYRASSADLQRLLNNNGSSSGDGDGVSEITLQNYTANTTPTIRNPVSVEAPCLSVGRKTSSPTVNASVPGRLGVQGTLHDPIEISSDSEHEDAADDEDEDVDVFYDCDTAPSIKHPPVLIHDCAVCGDSNHISDMPSLSTCKHQAATCAACFACWIESELTTKGWKGMTCPDVSCNVILTHYDVLAYATPEVFAQYDMYSMRDALGQVANFRWCHNPACTSGQEHDDDGYIFKCVACGHKACVVHDVDWHEGETCDEYTYRVSGAKEREQRAREEASVAAIKKLSKKCPGPDCAFNIEKSAGCDHMTCSRCRYEFCWVCLADYQKIRKRGNTAHDKTCRYHTSRIV